MEVNPDSESIQIAVPKKCGVVAVRESVPDRIYAPAGNMVPGFAKEIERSGLFEAVYYPTRPDDQVDLTIDCKFDVKFDPNMGSNLSKSFVTGLFLFLPEPLFWYDYNYHMNGKVDIYSGKTLDKSVEAQTTSGMSLKFLSLGEAVNLESETLTKSKSSLYKQLINKLSEYCGNK